MQLPYGERPDFPCSLKVFLGWPRFRVSVEMLGKREELVSRRSRNASSPYRESCKDDEKVGYSEMEPFQSVLGAKTGSSAF